MATYILETYNLLKVQVVQHTTRLNHKEVENLNISITSKEIESVIKNLSEKITSRWLNWWTFKELTAIFFKLVQKIKEERRLSNSFLWCQHYPDTKTRQRHYKKENYRPMYLMNNDAKILNKIFTNRIQKNIIRIIYHDQVGFISGMQG